MLYSCNQILLRYRNNVIFKRGEKGLRSFSYLVHVENKVKLTDILKAFVERFHKYLVNGENVM